MVDDSPVAGAGDGTVTSKGPSASRSSGSAANAAEDGEDNERNQETECTTRRTHGGFDDGGHGLTGGKGDELGDFWKHEADGDEEDEAGNGVEEDGEDHGLGDLDGRLLDLFTHTAGGANDTDVSIVLDNEEEIPEI